MTRAERKAALILHGIKMRDVAQKLKVQPTTVSQVVAGRSKSARIQKYLAKQIGKTVEEIWPNSIYAA